MKKNLFYSLMALFVVLARIVSNSFFQVVHLRCDDF